MGPICHSQVIPATQALRKKIITALPTADVKLTNAIIATNPETVIAVGEELLAASKKARADLHNLARKNNLTDEDKTRWQELLDVVTVNMETYNTDLVPQMCLTPHMAHKLGLEQDKDAAEEAKDASNLRSIADKMTDRSNRGKERAKVLSEIRVVRPDTITVETIGMFWFGLRSRLIFRILNVYFLPGFWDTLLFIWGGWYVKRYFQNPGKVPLF